MIFTTMEASVQVSVSLPAMYKDSINDSPTQELKCKGSTLVSKPNIKLTQSSYSSSSHSSATTIVPEKVKLLVSVANSVNVTKRTEVPKAVGVPVR